MKRSRHVKRHLAALTLAAACRYAAADEPVSPAAVEMQFFSAYVWRGQVLNDEAVAQPALSVTRGPFTAGAWANFNLTDAAGVERKFTEVDLSLAYGTEIRSVALEAGWVEYLFPNQTLTDETGTGQAWPGTRETYLSVSRPVGPVTPALTVSRDIGEADSWYGTGSLSSAVPLAGQWTVEGSASLGWAAEGYNLYYFGIENDALNDAVVGVALQWAPTANWTASASWHYVWLPERRIREAARALYKHDDRHVIGVGLSHSF